MDGGISYVIRELLTILFFVSVLNLATSGVYLEPLASLGVFLFATFGAVVSGGKALKEICTCKGASGMKRCILCKNCVLNTCFKGAMFIIGFRKRGTPDVNQFDPTHERVNLPLY